MSGASRTDSSSFSEDEWYQAPLKSGATSQGLRVADTLNEVKSFAYECFDQIDTDGDGFLSRAELDNALKSDLWKWREKSFICFLLRRIDDISESYDEEWDCAKHDGISRADIQEYFKIIRTKISGT